MARKAHNLLLFKCGPALSRNQRLHMKPRFHKSSARNHVPSYSRPRARAVTCCANAPYNAGSASAPTSQTNDNILSVLQQPLKRVMSWEVDMNAYVPRPMLVGPQYSRVCFEFPGAFSTLPYNLNPMRFSNHEKLSITKKGSVLNRWSHVD